MYAALGYPRQITIAEYRERYKRGDIAARIVEAYPKATWRGGAELIEDEDPGTETAFERAWRELDDRLHIWPTFARADILAGIGRYAIILLGAPGEFSEPLEHIGSPDKLLYLTPFAEDDAPIEKFDLDSSSDDSGSDKLPVETSRSRPAGPPKSFIGRASFHVADGASSMTTCTVSHERRVWNRLDDLDKVAGRRRRPSAERLRLPVRSRAGCRLSRRGEEAERGDREFMHNLRRFIRTRGVR